MQGFFDAMGGRKFAMALLALILGTVVEAIKAGGMGEAYVMLLVGIVGVFSGANALVSWKGMQVGEGHQAPAETAAPPAPEPVDMSPYINAIAELQGKVAQMEQEQQVQAQALQKASELIKALILNKQ